MAQLQQTQQPESDLDRALRMMNEGLTNLRDAQAKTEQLASTAPKATADPKDSLLGTKVTKLLGDSGYSQDAADINALGDVGSMLSDLFSGDSSGASKDSAKKSVGGSSDAQDIADIMAIVQLFA